MYKTIFLNLNVVAKTRDQCSINSLIHICVLVRHVLLELKHISKLTCNRVKIHVWKNYNIFGRHADFFCPCYAGLSFTFVLFGAFKSPARLSSSCTASHVSLPVIICSASSIPSDQEFKLSSLVLQSSSRWSSGTNLLFLIL